MPPVLLEPAIPASDRTQTQALDRAATGIGQLYSSRLSEYKILQELLRTFAFHEFLDVCC
jgi:hypothetical protein